MIAPYLMETKAKIIWKAPPTCYPERLGISSDLSFHGVFGNDDFFETQLFGFANLVFPVNVWC